MKSALNNVAQIIMAMALVMLAMLSIACDKNMAPPEELMNPGLSVTIGDFSASAVKIVTGDSTTLSWSVSDPKDIIQSISIDPGVSGALQMSGSKVVYPKHNTIYHLNIYSNNEIVKSQSIGITVTDDEGNEIPADADLSEPEIPTTEAVCDDKIDDDADGLTDCEDDDCASVALCQEPTYYFSDCEEAPHVVEGAVYAGEDLTITWKNCPFDEITVNGLAGYSFSAADGAYEFSAGEAGEVTVLLVGRVNGASKDTNTVKVDVSAVVIPEFSADVTFTITPSTVFAGQSYTVSWNVNNALEARMGDHAELQGEEVIAVATDNTTYTLTVVDNGGIPETFEKSVKVKKFETNSANLGGSVTKMVKGRATGEFYFITEGNTIYKTMDALNTVSSFVPEGVTSQVESVLVDGETVYVGNGDGVFKSGAEAYTQVSFSAGLQSVQALYKISGSKILAGTTRTVYTLTSGDPYYATQQITSFGSNTSVFQFMKDPANQDYIVALTNKGIYQSADRGATFSSLFNQSDLKGGHWEKGSGNVWTDDQIFEWNGSSFSETTQFHGVNGINFVLKASGRIFVATGEGVWISEGTGYFASNLGSDVRYLVAQGSFLKSIVAVTADGKTHKINVGFHFNKTSRGGQ